MTTTAIPITTAEQTETTTDAPGLIDASAESSDPTLEAEGQLDDGPERTPCEMKFTAKQDDLLKVLTLVMKAVSVRSTLPVLSHVLVATREAALEGSLRSHLELPPKKQALVPLK